MVEQAEAGHRVRKTRRQPPASRATPQAKGRGDGRKPASARRRSLLGRAFGWCLRMVLNVLGMAVLALLLAVVLMRWIDPPGGPYMWGEAWRLGGVEFRPVRLDETGLGPARAAIAAEDARFCEHSGLDWEAISEAVADYRETGRLRGASTISQQVAKNVFLWHGRTLARKALEVPFVGLIEALWGKRRILEVYLNIAEFDEGVFGIDAAARHYYGVPAAALTGAQTARLMTLLPSPKARDPRGLSSSLARRARQIAAGAETVAVQGLDACLRRDAG